MSGDKVRVSLVDDRAFSAAVAASSVPERRRRVCVRVKTRERAVRARSINDGSRLKKRVRERAKCRTSVGRGLIRPVEDRAGGKYTENSIMAIIERRMFRCSVCTARRGLLSARPSISLRCVDAWLGRQRAHRRSRVVTKPTAGQGLKVALTGFAIFSARRKEQKSAFFHAIQFCATATPNAQYFIPTRTCRTLNTLFHPMENRQLNSFKGELPLRQNQSSGRARQLRSLRSFGGVHDHVVTRNLCTSDISFWMKRGILECSRTQQRQLFGPLG